MKLIARAKPDQNLAALDPWTVIHFAAGMAAGLMDIRFQWAIAGSVAYELLEQRAERRRWAKELFETSHVETLPNALADTLFFALGHRCGVRWNASGPSSDGEGHQRGTG